MNQTATLADLLLGSAPAIREGVEVAGDVVVVAYDAATQSADVRAAVSLPGGPGPVVYGVPVRWPSGGGRSLVWGLNTGDLVTAVIRSRSHDEVDRGEDVPLTPASTRRFSWADCYLIPSGCVPGAPLEAAAWRSDGQPTFALPDLEALFLGASTASERLVLVSELRTFLVSLRGALVNHVHPGVVVGLGSTGASATSWPSVPAAASMSSARIKVDS